MSGFLALAFQIITLRASASFGFFDVLASHTTLVLAETFFRVCTLAVHSSGAMVFGIVAYATVTFAPLVKILELPAIFFNFRAFLFTFCRLGILGALVVLAAR